MGPFLSSEDMNKFYSELNRRPDNRVFTIFDNTTGTQVGSVIYAADSPENRKIEIGIVWISPVVHRRGICKAAVNCLINHAFKIGYERIEWKCIAFNLKSKKLAQKLGFRLEVTASESFYAHGNLYDVHWFSLNRKLSFKLLEYKI